MSAFYVFLLFSMCYSLHVAVNAVFELHGSQSMLGPLTSYDGPLTLRKIPSTEGAAVGPLTFVHHP